MAVLAFENENNYWWFVFVVIAILFNPVFPFHLGRELWQVVDLIVAAILVISLFTLKLPKAK